LIKEKGPTRARRQWHAWSHTAAHYMPHCQVEGDARFKELEEVAKGVPLAIAQELKEFVGKAQGLGLLLWH